MTPASPSAQNSHQAMRIEELERENAALREQIAEWQGDWQERAEKAEAENAALKEQLDAEKCQAHKNKVEAMCLENENAALKEANTKLIGAIDMIRETLHGGNVDDLLYIINTALDAVREGK
jgi:chromosome segregation ATPase